MRISDWSSDVCSSDLPSGSSTDKYLPPVNRIDNSYGDRNLVCSCPPLSDYAEASSEARRVGSECVSLCISRWSLYTDHKDKKIISSMEHVLTTIYNTHHNYLIALII